MIFTYVKPGHIVGNIIEAISTIDDEPIVTYDGTTIEVETEQTQADCDEAIDLLDDTLFLGKTNRKRQASRKTHRLERRGVYFKRPSDNKFKRGPLILNDRGLIKSIRIDVDEGSVSLPVSVPNAKGKRTRLFTLADVDKAYEKVVDRQDYIQGFDINADGSAGEIKLKELIDAATTQAELDAIIDDRS